MSSSRTAPGVRLPMATNVSLTPVAMTYSVWPGRYVDRHRREGDPARLAGHRVGLVQGQHVALDQVRVGGVVPTARP